MSGAEHQGTGLIGRWAFSDRQLALALAVLAGGFAAIGISIPSLWADEGATISATTRSWSDLFRLLGNIDAVHGAYYVIMKAWFAVFPVNAFALRAPSLVATAATVALVYLLARTWFDRWAAIAAAGLLAVLPRVSWMAIEGRSWAMSTLVATAATLVLVRWVRQPRLRGLLAYVVLMAIGCNLHIYMVFLAAAHCTSILLNSRDRRLVSMWLFAGGLSVAATIPPILAAYRERAQLGEREPFTLASWAAGLAVKQFALGDTPGDSLLASPIAPGLWRAGSVALAIISWALIGRALTAPLLRRPARAECVHALQWTLPWVLLPSLAVMGLSVAGFDLYHPRYFTFTAPAFAIAIAAGLVSMRSPVVKRILAATLVLTALPVYVSQRGPMSKAGYDWAQVATAASTFTQSGDTVYFSPSPATRTIGIAYPLVFDQLRDLTLARTPADDASLAGDSTALSLATLDQAPDQVFAVWSVRAADRAADVASFTAAGFHPTVEWEGPQTIAVLFRRSGRR